MRARTTTFFIALLALAAGLLTPSPAAAACANAGATPGSISAKALSKATLCLLNEERADRNLRPLKSNGKLGKAAKRYSKEMVKRRFFAHVSPSGSTVRTRVARTRYMRGVRAWAIGENIAFGTGASSTPKSIVRSWMNSPGHRANILNGKYREIGIGIADGAPVATTATVGATYTTNFGFRR